MTAKAKLAKQPDRKIYGLAEAKARLSEVVAKAQTQGAQQITYRGRPAAYIVSAAEWEQRTRRKGSLVDFYRDTGVYGIGLEFDKATGMFREVQP